MEFSSKFRVNILFVALITLTILIGLSEQVNAEQEGDFTYTITDGQAQVTECSSWASGEVIIPSTLGGFPVTSIGRGAISSRPYITSLKIPKDVKFIGDDALTACERLTSIIVDPDNLYFSSNNGVLYDKAGTTLLKFPAGLANVNIPEGVISIGRTAFYCNLNLTEVTIPSCVKNIGLGAFSACRNLKSISFTKGLVSIGEEAFHLCDHLTSIDIPEGVVSIGDNAFGGCTELKNVSLHNGLKSIGGVAFQSSGITAINLPAGLTDIGSAAFYYCQSLNSICIPQSVTSIGINAFYGSGLNSITFYSSNTIIPPNEVNGNKAIPLNTTIFGYAGSTAEDYWEKYGNPHEVLPAKKKAIYILPGFMGSELYDTSGINIWRNNDLLRNDVLSFKTGVESLFTRNSDGTGLETELKANMEKDAYGTGDFYKPLVQRLEDEFYNKGYDVVFYPYNWSGDLNDSELALENDINSKGYEKVIFVTHSTGGLLAAAFIAKDDNSKKVDKALLIAAPLYGTYDSYEAIEEGRHPVIEENFGLLSGPIAGWVINALKNSPTAYQLFPSDEYLGFLPTILKSVEGLSCSVNSINGLEYDVFLQGRSKIWMNNTLFFTGSNSHKTFREAALKGDIVRSLGKVKTILIGSSKSNKLTAYQMTYEQHEGIDGYFYTTDLATNYNGDGTVYHNSAFGLKKDLTHKLLYADFKQYYFRHEDLPNKEEVLKYIVSEISGTNSDYGEIKNPVCPVITYSEDQGMTGHIKFNILSDLPYDVKITDENNTVLATVIDDVQTGFDDNKFYYSESMESETGCSGILYVPNEGVSVEFYHGTESGTPINFNADISTLDADGNKTATSTYNEKITGIEGQILSFDMFSKTDKAMLGNLVVNRTESVINKPTDWSIAPTIELELNESKKIELAGSESAIVNPMLAWGSSDDSVVSVSNDGVLTANGYGVAYISATNGNKAVSSEITVRYAAQTVELSDVNIFIGSWKQIQPQFTPENTTETNMTYQTENTDIIRIDEFDGITGLAPGTATVVGTNEDGVSDTFTVTVEIDPTTLESIAVTSPPNKLSYNIGESLDISGLVVTGTYSDGTTKAETVTADNITGFDSSKTAMDQVLTITINGKTTTYTVQIIDSNERQLGDVDGNGSITAYDALMALQIATGKKTGTTEELKAADVDKSGSVQAFDALRILQYATGKITSF